MDTVQRERTGVTALTLQLDELRIALVLATVERVLRAVYVTPLSQAPEAVLGIINVRGCVLPVFDLRRRFGLPARAITPSDCLVLARTARRTVAIAADRAVDVVQCPAPAVTAASDILPDIGPIDGVARFGGDLLLIHDLDRFLSLEDEGRLRRAMGDC